MAHNVLARLLAPGEHAKRVSLIYRPLTAGQAAAEVERQVNAAQFRSAYRRARRSGGGPPSRRARAGRTTRKALEPRGKVGIARPCRF